MTTGESMGAVPWYVKLQNIPKQVIYLVLVAIFIVPLARPLKLPLVFSANTKNAYEMVDSLPAGSYVFHSIAISPAVDAELWPQMLALSRHYMSKNLKVIYWSYTQEGLMYAERIRTAVAAEYGYKYGIDYAVLPFKAGQETAVAALKDFSSAFLTDAYGDSLSALSLFQGFTGMDDASLLVVNTGGDDVTYFVRHIEPLFNTPIIAAGTAPVLPYIGPFMGSGQIQGAVIGMSGAAEYEVLADVPGSAIGAMDAQQLGHVLIVVLVLLGNFGYLVQKRSLKRRGAHRG